MPKGEDPFGDGDTGRFLHVWMSDQAAETGGFEPFPDT